MAPPFLSVVIPAYNEESRIERALEQVTRYLSTRDYLWEVVVGDDGSTDGTARLVEQAASEGPGIRLLSLEHRGKGWAVKNAILAASGEYRLVCDADLPVPLEQMERFLPPILSGVDIAVGSRDVPGSRRFGEPVLRRLMGRVYNLLVRLLALPGFRDTQCGFKCFRGAIVPQLFQRQVAEGFTFDTEVLFLARKRGLTVQEVAVDWHYGEGSKVRPFRDSLAMAGDLLRMRWRHFSRRNSEDSIEGSE